MATIQEHRTQRSAPCSSPGPETPERSQSVPPLFHYTCRHCVRALRKMRNPLLFPSPIIWLPPQEVVWLTDLPVPDALGLGLTSEFTPCDRTEFRLSVLPIGAMAWSEAATIWECPPGMRAGMEEGRMPEHWFVSCEFVPVLSIRRTESVAS